MSDGSFFNRATMPGIRCLSTVAAPGGLGEKLEQVARGIDVEILAERKLLAERLPVDHQRQVDGELHRRAVRRLGPECSTRRQT